MTVQIELPEELEKSLAAEAKIYGMELPQYLESLLRQRAVETPARPTMTAAEKAKAWREGATRFPDTPPLSDEAISRENLYSERG